MRAVCVASLMSMEPDLFTGAPWQVGTLKWMLLAV
jgi:hypothetical protein